MNYSTKTVDGHEVIFSSDWIHKLEQKEHFICYHRQARLVYCHCSRDEKIVEIGCGTLLLSDLLKRRGWSIRTLDIDAAKQPDICADALSCDYTELEVDTVLAFEVFEHMPYSTFTKLLRKLRESRVKRLLFSVPRCQRRLFQAGVSVPRMPKLKIDLKFHRAAITTPTHYWELARKSRQLPNERRIISDAAFHETFAECGWRVQSEGNVGRITFYLADY